MFSAGLSLVSAKICCSFLTSTLRARSKFTMFSAGLSFTSASSCAAPTGSPTDVSPTMRSAALSFVSAKNCWTDLSAAAVCGSVSPFDETNMHPLNGPLNALKCQICQFKCVHAHTYPYLGQQAHARVRMRSQPVRSVDQRKSRRLSPDACFPLETCICRGRTAF